MTESKGPRVGVAVKGSAIRDTVRAIRKRSGDEEYGRILSTLDEEARALLGGDIVATNWYPLDPFLRFLEADLRETAGGDEAALIERTEALIERQLRGIYRLFVRLGSPEFVLKRISIVHQTYYRGVDLETTSLAPGRAVLRYTGFEPRHRLVGYSLIGFFRKALHISGAKDVQASFTVPIEAGRGYAELVVTWSH